jgi:uncharacterized protein (TIGR03437 family)
VNVTLTVTGAPVMSANPTSLAMTYQIGQTSFPTDSVIITSVGGAVPVVVTASSVGNWLSASPVSATTPATVAVWVSLVNMTEGSYRGLLSITSTAASNSLSIPVTLTILADPRPTVPEDGVMNAASLAPGITPGALVRIVGKNLSTITDPGRSWADADVVGADLPKVLDGTSVLINGKSAAVLFVSSARLTVQAPDDDAQGSVQVEVTTPTGTTTATALLLPPPAPSLFVDGKSSSGSSYVQALHEDGTPVGVSDPKTSASPSRPGEIVWLYGTGFGRTDPLVPCGQIVLMAPRLVDDFVISVAGIPATVYFGGLIGPGLYQFNVVVPPDLPDGDHEVLIRIGGQTTQANIVLPVQRPTN